MPHRKAASVLPEPVGARIRLWRPPAMAGQPWACAAVGSPKVVANHSRTGGENRSRATPGAYGRTLTVPVGSWRAGTGPARAGSARAGSRRPAVASRHARVPGSRVAPGVRGVLRDHLR